MNKPADDLELARSAGRGDSSALRELLARHDRQVRYAIFRLSRRQCARDPEWLDGVAADCWSALLDAVSRRRPIAAQAFRSYLLNLVRNRTISALRRVKRQGPTSADTRGHEPIQEQPPLWETLASLEDLDALRNVVQGLDEPDTGLMAELDLIVENRWTEAASRLGIAESTLRSRWKALIHKIRSQLQKLPS